MKIKLKLGFALFSTLLFMQILAILGLYALEQSFMLSKIVRVNLLKLQNENAAQALLEQIENKLQHQDPRCLLTPLGDEKLMAAIYSKQACTGWSGSFAYRYVVEFLTQDSCALIINQGVAEYLRVTLLVNAQRDEARTILQSTIIKPGVSQERCSATLHQVAAGRMSWVEL
jgi:Tfp pilus assembly protein PilX